MSQLDLILVGGTTDMEALASAVRSLVDGAIVRLISGQVSIDLGDGGVYFDTDGRDLSKALEIDGDYESVINVELDTDDPSSTTQNIYEHLVQTTSWSLALLDVVR